MGRVKQWKVEVWIGSKIHKNEKRKRVYGKSWYSALNAAKNVNKICEEYNLDHKNPGIGSEPEIQRLFSSNLYQLENPCQKRKRATLSEEHIRPQSALIVKSSNEQKIHNTFGQKKIFQANKTLEK